MTSTAPAPTDIHDQIKGHLDAGFRVFSSVPGRVGEIINVYEDSPLLYSLEVCPRSRYFKPVNQHRHLHGITRFNGRRVELRPIPSIHAWVVSEKGFYDAD